MGFRKIIHIDMDAFYASVEQRDNPDLRGKPVVVGGFPGRRGVVAACSYEARKYGIRSAMSSTRAEKLCPHAVFIRPRFEVYGGVSRCIRDIFYEYTELVEPLSLDEAYLDVTENRKDIPSATHIAEEIRRRIFLETGLTASAGVSCNKFLAKVASDWQKPDGLTVIRPEDADRFLDALPIGRFHGIGAVTEKKMKAMGVHTGADLKRTDLEELKRAFGKAGEYYYEIAHGRDLRPVSPDRIRKSAGKETTLASDVGGREEMMEILRELAGQVENSLRKKGESGPTVTLKVKYHDFVSITRGVTLPRPVSKASEIMERMPELLDKTEAGPDRKVRLLGITVSGFGGDKEKKPCQLKLPF